VIAIDFDGTLCEHKFPDIGNEVPGAFAVLRELVAAGHRLILWTMRNDNKPDGECYVLAEAVEWCRARGVEFWSVNSNPEQASWSQSQKCYAHYYIDDAAIGCPLRLAFSTERPMADWAKIRELLVNEGLLT